MLSVSDGGVLQTTVAAEENSFIFESGTRRRGEVVRLERRDAGKAGFLVGCDGKDEGEERQPLT